MADCQHLKLMIFQEEMPTEEDKENPRQYEVVRCTKCSTAISIFPIEHWGKAIKTLDHIETQLRNRS